MQSVELIHWNLDELECKLSLLRYIAFDIEHSHAVVHLKERSLTYLGYARVFESIINEILKRVSRMPYILNKLVLVGGIQFLKKV